MKKAEVAHNSLHYIILTFTCFTCSLLICINIDPYILSACKWELGGMEEGDMKSSKKICLQISSIPLQFRRE